MTVELYFIAKKWIYRAVFAVVFMIAAVGVTEFKGVLRNTAPEDIQPQALPPALTITVPKAPEKPVSGDATGKTAKSEFFVEYRLERDRTRSQRIDMLRETVNNPNSASEIRKEANRELMSVFRTAEIEMELENLIRAEGYKDAVVYLQEAEKTATVTIHAAALSPEEREKLVSLFKRVTGLNRENIAFICKN